MGSSLLDTYAQAEQLRLSGELQKSADLCREMLNQNPGFAYAYHLMSDLFRSTGNIEKALHFSTISIQLSPQVYEFHLHQAQLFYQLGRWNDASQAYAAAGQLQPDSAASLIGQADCRARMAEFAGAHEAYAQARALGAQPEVDLHEANTLVLSGEWVAAETLYDQVLTKWPDKAEAYVHKGRLLLLAGRDSEAESCFARAIAYQRPCVEAMHGLALASERRGDLDMAVELMLQSVKTNTHLFDGLVLLGSLLLRKQNFTSAEEVFRQALQITPDQVFALRGLLAALAAREKVFEALQYIEERLGVSPEHENLLFLQSALRGSEVAAPPPHYISSLFNDYSQRFACRFLLRQCAVANSLCDALRALPQVYGKTGLSLLDLGCGAGAAADALRSVADVRVGVDLSSGMLEHAGMRKLYTQSYALDVNDFLMGSDRTFDLIVAADMLPYLGDWSGFFSCVRNVMAAGSTLALSFETGEAGSAYRLHHSGRFKHAPDYFLACAKEAGLEVIAHDPTVVRNELSQPVKMMLALLKKQLMH